MNEEQNTNQLPKDWKWVKLGDVCNKIGDIDHKMPKQLSIGYPYVSTKDFTDDFKISFEKAKYISEEDYLNLSRKIRPERGDIIFPRYGTIGKNVLIDFDKEFLVSYSCAVIKPNHSLVLSKYVYLYSLSPKIGKEIKKYTVETTQANVGIASIKSFLFPFPSLKIQQDIVSKIEELFSELDKGIENLRTAQQQLKTYRQSVLKWAFEGRLTNKNVKEGELQKGWEMSSIEEVARVGTGATPLKSKSEYYGGNIAWVTSGALNEEYVKEARDFVTEKAVKETNLSVYPKHTLLVAMYGEGKTRGKCSELLIEACTNQAIAAIYFDEQQIEVKPYLKYFLLKNYTDVRKKSSGGVQPNLNLGIIKKLQFPLAPIEEQNKIIQEIESRLSVADKMEESITQSLQHAEALRQSILKKAFEGKLFATDTIGTIKQTSKVIPLERKVLAGKIIHLLHEDRYFGLTKFQKIFYLVENFSEVKYETNFIQERAGPYDKEFTTSFRKEMQEKDWVQEEQKGSITKFIPGENIGSLIANYGTHFREKGKQIVFVIQQLKDKSTHDAELIATLYAVWNNRLIKKKSTKVNLLIEDFFNWSPKKKEEFQEEEIVATHNWMKEIKFIPKGFGKVIEI